MRRVWETNAAVMLRLRLIMTNLSGLPETVVVTVEATRESFSSISSLFILHKGR
jgi:hypothetical protein